MALLLCGEVENDEISFFPSAKSRKLTTFGEKNMFLTPTRTFDLRSSPGDMVCAAAEFPSGDGALRKFPPGPNGCCWWGAPVGDEGCCCACCCWLW